MLKSLQGDKDGDFKFGGLFIFIFPNFYLGNTSNKYNSSHKRIHLLLEEFKI